MRVQLVLMGVETAQREHDHRHTTLAFLRSHHLGGSTHAVAKSTLRELGDEVELLAAQTLGRIADVVFCFKQMLQRGIALRMAGHGETRLVDEGLGVVERDSASTRQRAQVVAANQHTISSEFGPATVTGLHAARYPAVVQVLGRFGRGFPDLDGSEMRQIGLRVTHALHDGQLAFFPHWQGGLELRVQTHTLVEFEDVFPANGDGVAQLVIGVVGIGHHGVEAVVAAF